jgi:putative transposase
MARPLRPQAAGATYHVTARGVARLPVFRDHDDRLRFLALLERVVDRFGWSCHAYCLMTTHYHVVVRTPEPDLGLGMKSLNGLYAQGFNKRHGGAGHVFESRYHSVVVETERHLLELCRYLALNPVRAGICGRPEDWPYGSFSAVMGSAAAPRCLTVAWVLAHFGSDRARARERLREFVEDGLGAAAALPGDTLSSQGLTP